MNAIVVQLGLATMRLGGRIASSGLTSETTSGTSGSIRQAEELSITMAPAAATLGAVASEAVLPTMKSVTNSTPMFWSRAISSFRMVRGSRKFGIPYASTPPSLCSASKIVTR